VTSNSLLHRFHNDLQTSAIGVNLTEALLSEGQQAKPTGAYYISSTMHGC
jgi:hypothetical protein